jgi:hypothetical protein
MSVMFCCYSFILAMLFILIQQELNESEALRDYVVSSLTVILLWRLNFACECCLTFRLFHNTQSLAAYYLIFQASMLLLWVFLAVTVSSTFAFLSPVCLVLLFL